MNSRLKTFTVGVLGFAMMASFEPASAAAVLYGVTGDGANTPESLFILDQTNASSTFVTSGTNKNGVAQPVRSRR